MEHACYHLITRGNQRQAVFLDKADYQEYLARLCLYKKRHPFLLYGYCLMPNHIHIVGEPHELKDLARFMQGLLRSYTAYFNKRYKKVGHLCQGRFKSKVIAKDRYLIDCIQYVENNPVRANLAKAIGEYHWSSYQERALGSGNGKKLLNEIRL
ncbi:MAG: hypothetical protein A3G38_03150 [Omnitrophica WOR_2 bacterium RIFCSPLOWO2_12_FULL_51_8]|nr:MAG: hypothetical protein A3G38_03150 [Omnitrophica WOR_2 bacterium RIFCSPLOWO2_12_FULL_51_8]